MMDSIISVQDLSKVYGGRKVLKFLGKRGFRALDGRAVNIADNPFAGFFYAASTFLCTPSSLAQDVGRGMGAQSGESGMRAVFEEAGYSQFRRTQTTPFNIIYEAKA